MLNSWHLDPRQSLLTVKEKRVCEKRLQKNGLTTIKIDFTGIFKSSNPQDISTQETQINQFSWTSL